jgi:hypothetical protein
MKTEWKDKMILHCIELLAANSDAQRSYLKQSGSYPCTDEIALEFDDAYRRFAAETDSEIPQSIIIKIDLLNSMLDRLSDSHDENIWNESSLETSHWNEIRNTAVSVLQEIG